MENASKALLAIAEILIGIIIISMAVYIFGVYMNTNKTYEEVKSRSEIKEFNNLFSKFVGRNNITAQEIVTLVKQLENLGYSPSDISNTIEVWLDNASKVDLRGEGNCKEFLEKSNDNQVKFSCGYNSWGKIVYDPNSAKVEKIIFKKPV